MKTLTYTDLSNYVGQLSRNNVNSNGSRANVLGNSFTNNAEISKLISVLSGKHVNGKNVKESQVEVKDCSTNFYIFVLLVQQSWIETSFKINSKFKKRTDELALCFGISLEDKDLLVEFLKNDEPYKDKNNAIYFNNDKSASSIKYIGANIMYSSTLKSEVLYLKYFEKYNLFLSKSFSVKKDPYHFFEDVTLNEINLINPSNYFMDSFGFNTFSELVNSVKSHQPFQFYEFEATSNTPKVVLDPEQGRVIISGSSLPFSPTNFFEPIIEWFNHYRTQGKEQLKVYIILEYFNTYTSKFLLSLTRLCDTMHKEGKIVTMYWYCEPDDTDMREFGEHLAQIFKPGFEHCLITDGVEELV